jgi:hypothetical protein
LGNPPSSKREFPLSYHSFIWIAVALMLIVKTVSDIGFHTQKEAIPIRTVSDARSVEPNSLVEVQLPLDLEKGILVESESGDETYSIVPFTGTGMRLLYAEPGTLAEGASPPFTGRTVAKDFVDEWSLSSTDDAKLLELFEGEVPEEAILVRRSDDEGINLWQWFITALAGVYLAWKATSLFRWFSTDESPEPPKPKSKADDEEWD